MRKKQHKPSEKTQTLFIFIESETHSLPKLYAWAEVKHTIYFEWPKNNANPCHTCYTWYYVFADMLVLLIPPVLDNDSALSLHMGLDSLQAGLTYKCQQLYFGCTLIDSWSVKSCILILYQSCCLMPFVSLFPLQGMSSLSSLSFVLYSFY